jgi:ABC-type branched-subunit amino acid transport system ATPase component
LVGERTGDHAILDIGDIAAGYGKIEILHGVSLRVAPGEVIAIIGPNGAGKSTVLKTIMGYLRPSRGHVTFDGQDITGLRTDLIVGRGLGYAPQGRIVFPHMTVRENLDMGGYLERDARRRAQAVEWLFTLFPRLGERKTQRAGSMSGGEQQMLAIARALMLRPRLLLLDEPSLGLSPRYVSLVFEKIQELNRQQGMAIVMVEQNARRALEIADRGYVLDIGENRIEGTGKDLLDDDEVKRLYLGYQMTRSAGRRAPAKESRP